MSDQSKIDDGWDAMLEDEDGSNTPTPKRRASRPARAKAPVLSAPPATGRKRVSTPPPPAINKTKRRAPAPPPATKDRPLLAPPPAGGSRTGSTRLGIPPPPATGPRTPSPASPSPPSTGSPQTDPAPVPAAAASPIKVSMVAPPPTTGSTAPEPAGTPPRHHLATPQLAPPPTVTPRSDMGLPPPPEFLSGATSAELPLENQVRSHETIPLVITPPPTEAHPLVPHAPAKPRPDESASIDMSDLDSGDEVGVSAPVPIDSLEIDMSDEASSTSGESLELDSPAEASSTSGESLEIDMRAETSSTSGDSVELDVLDLNASSSMEVPINFDLSDPAVPRHDAGRSARSARSAGEAARPARPRVHSFGESLASEPRRPPTMWIAAAAAVVVLGLAAWLLSGDDDQAPAQSATAAEGPRSPDETKAAHDSPPPSDTKPAGGDESAPAPTPEPEDTVPVDTSPVDDTTPAPDDSPVTDQPEPTPEPTPEAQPIVVPRDHSEAQAAYDAAAAEYELSDSQDALLTMTVAACSMDEGPKARNAFRKLKGRELRSQAMVACREADVNVTSNVSGYTGGELMAQARYAFDKGKYEAAYDKAHASNKVERSSDALLLKGRAACKLGRDAEAKRLIPHISKKARATLIESCKADGVEL